MGTHGAADADAADTDTALERAANTDAADADAALERAAGTRACGAVAADNDTADTDVSCVVCDGAREPQQRVV